jgi:alkane 1-monooxygenase
MRKLKETLTALPYAGSFLLPAGALTGHALGGLWILLPVALLYLLLPVLDLLLSRYPRAKPAGALPRSPAFRVILWVWVAAQLGLVYWGLRHMGADSSVLERIGVTLSVGVCTGVGMNYAHELLHGARFDRILAEIQLLSVSYPQLCVDHLTGHHRNYGKWMDYGTSRFGEGYYRATFRHIRGSWRTTWESEKRRLRRYHRGAFDPRNRTLRFIVALAAIYASIAWWFGVPGVAFFAVQSALAIGTLLGANYIEHYGLVRREISPGVYEPPGAYLSWDAPGYLSDLFGLRVQRHSDHHLTMTRPYQQLLYQPAAPQLPGSYGFMLALAAVPPLWRKIIDPRVTAWNRQRQDTLPDLKQPRGTPTEPLLATRS